jgi:hypothetical protein
LRDFSDQSLDSSSETDEEQEEDKNIRKGRVFDLG